MAELILELVIEFVLQAVFEVLLEVGWRGLGGAGRTAIGVGAATAFRLVAGFVLTALIAASVGWWRGESVGSLGWGWWSALAVAVVAGIFSIVRVVRPAGPRPSTRASLTWWPASRCAWFALTNGMFAAFYALAATR